MNCKSTDKEIRTKKDISKSKYKADGKALINFSLSEGKLFLFVEIIIFVMYTAFTEYSDAMQLSNVED